MPGIVVIGGTGLIGVKCVAILRQRGHEVVAASPTLGVNTIVARYLKAVGDPRTVVRDPEARYFGGRLSHRPGRY